MYAIAAVFLMLSGTSGLIYEITWARLLSPHVGSDNAAISIVLSCFFLGMAIGSYFSAFAKKSRYNMFSIYIILEVIIAVSALALLPAMANLGTFIELYPYFATSLFGKFTLSLALFIVPTVCLGATFPIVFSLVIKHQKDIGLRLGQLYFFNTVGAIVGSLSAGFILIPITGLDGAIYFAASLNFAIVCIAIYYRKNTLDDSFTTPDSNDQIQITNAKPTHYGLGLVSLSITGFVLLASEVAWSKYLSIFTISSVQSFSVILASTLSGIAAGSWCIRHQIHQIKNTVKFIILCFIVASILLMFVRWGFNALPTIMLDISAMNIQLENKQMIRYMLVAFLLFPATFMFGLLFPLSLSLCSNNMNHVSQHTAKAYSLNTFAGIIGALIAGFWILPRYGTDALLLIMILTLLLIPVHYFFTNQSGLRKPSLAIALIGIIATSLYSEGMNFEHLISAVDYRYGSKPEAGKTTEYIYLKEGNNSVISLVKHDEEYAYLQNNGLQEAMIPLSAKSKPILFESLQAYVPYLLHENPKSAFVVGYGGGVTTLALLATDITRIDIVEIEKNVIEAVQKIPNGPASSLKDPRINLHIGDARTTLLIKPDKYDIITSQPSHPWISGAANLFTKEFFSLVHSRLNDNGFFSQWVALFGMDITTFKAILKAFYEIFPYGFTMENKKSGDMMLIGSKQPILFNYPQINQRMALPSIKTRLAQFQMSDPNALFWFFSLSRKEIMSSTLQSEINTDFNILSETRLSSFYVNGINNRDLNAYINATASMDIIPLLDVKEAKYQLFEMGKNFLDWNSPEKTKNIANQLIKIDAVWGASLKHEILYWEFDYFQATALYKSQSEWMDISHYRQFLIYFKEKNWSLSLEALSKIRSVALRQLSQVRMLYEKQDWTALSSIQPLTPLAQKWQFMARLNQNDLSVLRQLASNTEIKYENLSTLQLILEAYKKTLATQEAQILDAQIKVIINARLNFYTNLAQNAKISKNTPWLTNLENEIEYLTSLNQ